MPGILGLKGDAPVAMHNLSYVYNNIKNKIFITILVPSCKVTDFSLVSTASALVLSLISISAFYKKFSSLSLILFTSTATNYLVNKALS